MSTADRYRRRKAMPWAFIVASLAAAGIILGSIAWLAQSNPVLSVVNPDRAAIDKWLRENLDDGDYEVVKWYPRRKRDDVTISAATFLEQGGHFAGDPSSRYCIRLKYRTKMIFGKRLCDRIFVLSNHQVIGYYDNVVDMKDRDLAAEKREAAARQAEYDAVRARAEESKRKRSAHWAAIEEENRKILAPIPKPHSPNP